MVPLAWRDRGVEEAGPCVISWGRATRRKALAGPPLPQGKELQTTVPYRLSSQRSRRPLTTGLSGGAQAGAHSHPAPAHAQSLGARSQGVEGLGGGGGPAESGLRRWSFSWSSELPFPEVYFSDHC